MPAPKSLFEPAGAMLAPHRLADSAVVMIDAQMKYVTGRLPLTGVDAALEEGVALIAAARERARPRSIHARDEQHVGSLPL